VARMPRVHARLRRATLLAALATLLPAAAASAGTPFTLGTTTNGNDEYALAMDDATGTAYVVWQTTATQVAFCRLPRGARTCASTTTITAPGEVGQPWLLRTPGTGELTLVDVRYISGNVRVWTSGDDGATWAGPVQVSDADPGTDSRRPLRLDGGFLLTPTTNPALDVDRWALDGSEAATTTRTRLPAGAVGSLVYDLMAAPTGTGLIATASNLADVYSWSIPDAAGADTAASWSASPTLVAAGEREPQLVAGGGQVYLFTQFGEISRLRKLSGGAFGPPVDVALGGSRKRADASEDGGDAARVTSGSAGIRAAVTTDGGATVGVRTVAFESGSFPDVAIDDSGQGLAIWKVDGNGLRAADLTDVTPPPSPGPGTPGTPGPTPTPVPGPPAPLYVPGGASGVPSSQTASGNGGVYTVTGPKSCVPRGGRFTATLKVRKQKRKGNLFVKVTKVDFSISGKIKKTDRRAPFRQTLTATATAAKGSVITMRARAFIKVRKIKRIPKKSVFLRIRVCS
jgi:hypothetical protein